MSSIVLELQKDLLQKDCDVMQVLRKAHLIAVKLNLTEFDAWIQGELHGYTCEAEKLPAYRHMKGELKAKNPRLGWIPAILSTQSGQTLDTIPIYESLSSLIDVGQKAKGNYFCYSYPPEFSMKICRQAGAPTYMEIALFISTHRIVEAVEQVKNCLLEWTINLESKGILGENMTFNETETESAKGLPQQVNYYGPVVHGNVTGSQIVSGSGNTATFYGAEAEIIHEVKESLEKEAISEDDMETAIELLEDISEKLSQNKKPGVIKAALSGLKDFLLAAGADITAALIVAKMQGMF